MGGELLPNAKWRSVSSKITDARTVCLDKLPGQSLWDHMKQGTLNERMLESAGKEYRRAH